MKWWLWLTFLFTVPVPYFMVVTGWVPVMRLLLFSGIMTAAALAEPDWIAGLIAAFFVLPALIFATLLYLLAALITRLLVRFVADSRRRVAFGFLIALCFAISLVPIYDTPLSNTDARANLFGIFD